MRSRFLFSILLITAGTAASAQQEEPVKTRLEFTTLAKVPPVKLSIKPTADTPSVKRLSGNKPAEKEYYQEGTLVDVNSLGKVYRMPVDRMLCLVPDANKNARMPVKKTRMPESMPNAYVQPRRF